MITINIFQLRKSPSPEPESSPIPNHEDSTEEEEIEEKCTIAAGFEVACYDVETLRALCDTLDEPLPPPKKRGRRSKSQPVRKQCEIHLHQMCVALLQEMEQHDAKFAKAASKAKIKVMKESQEPDLPDEPGLCYLKNQSTHLSCVCLSVSLSVFSYKTFDLYKESIGKFHNVKHEGKAFLLETQII